MESIIYTNQSHTEFATKKKQNSKNTFKNHLHSIQSIENVFMHSFIKKKFLLEFLFLAKNQNKN